MKLLRTDTSDLQLCEYFGTELASIRYAILSHTWEEEEILFTDIGTHGYTKKKGYQKVDSARRLAESQGYEVIWIDTCCIDKSSSAELSEAINSMYAWYKGAHVCYAYLSGVHETVPWDAGLDSDFARSRWFTRGWTLQELIAPRVLRFYSQDWKNIGNKTDLQHLISKITSIDSAILVGLASIEGASIARRMSWAAHRVTTRTEDIAYCLMGIFSISMPLLYGEGKRAFMRLQEELMKHTDDQSIFAWFPYNDIVTGMLADSPLDFARTGSVVPYQGGGRSSSFSLTNKGINIEVGLSPPIDGICGAALNCIDLSDVSTGDFFQIYLRQIAKSDRLYARCHAPFLGWLSAPLLVNGRGDLKNVDILQVTKEKTRHYVVFLRRGPKSVGHHYFELKWITESLPRSSTNNDPVIPLLESFIQRNRNISRGWIPDQLPYRLDYGLLSLDGAMQQWWPGQYAWSLEFESVSMSSKTLLQVNIYTTKGGLQIYARTKDVGIDYVRSGEGHKREGWTWISDAESLVTVQKLVLPICDFYVLDFNNFDLSKKENVTAPTNDEEHSSQPGPNLQEEGLTDQIYELSAVTEPHGITEAEQDLLELKKEMELERLRLEDIEKNPHMYWRSKDGELVPICELEGDMYFVTSQASTKITAMTPFQSSLVRDEIQSPPEEFSDKIQGEETDVVSNRDDNLVEGSSPSHQENTTDLENFQVQPGKDVGSPTQVTTAPATSPFAVPDSVTEFSDSASHRVQVVEEEVSKKEPIG